MPMNQEQMAKVQQWLKDRLNYTCPICQGKSFSFEDVLALPVVSAGLLPPHGLYIPVTCSDCSYTVFLSEFFLR